MDPMSGHRLVPGENGEMVRPWAGREMLIDENGSTNLPWWAYIPVVIVVGISAVGMFGVVFLDWGVR